LYELTWKLLDKWENPTVKNISIRYQYAQAWYNQVNSLTSTTPIINSATQTSSIEKLLSVAKNEVGYHEGNDNYIKYTESNWDNQLYGANA